MASAPQNGVEPTAPPPHRLYWTCQIAGWGGFTAYVVGSYLMFNDSRRAADLVNMVMWCGLAPPLATHGLRRWMYGRSWLMWPAARLVPRATAAVVALSSGVTALSAMSLVVMRGSSLSVTTHLSILAGFCWAFAGWLFIYFAVHARRSHDSIALIARDAQLRSLRAQLNPHFLFNCLNSVRSLIAEDPARAASMVTGLAEILRYSLASDRKDTASLAEEIAVIDEYLALERVRLEERLQVERMITPSALTARVPPMLVQTLVENAVKHGISELPHGGVLRIEARVRDGHVEIVVTNSGRFKSPGADGGYGLRNATERLRLQFGDAASLTVREHDGHTVAALTIPRPLAT